MIYPLSNCDGCGHSIPGGVIAYQSSVFRASGNLCKQCHNHEEREIDRLGTNDIPALREQYKNPPKIYDCDPYED